MPGFTSETNIEAGFTGFKQPVSAAHSFTKNGSETSFGFDQWITLCL